jgi:hypothetical protein
LNHELKFTVSRENEDSRVVSVSEMYPDPELLAKRENTGSRPASGRRGLKRRNSHALDDLLEENSDRFNGIDVLKLLSPGADYFLIAKHPSFMEGGFAPAMCIMGKGSAGENVEGFYKVRFYDGTEASLPPTELICIQKSDYDEIVSVCYKIENTPFDDNELSSDKSSGKTVEFKDCPVVISDPEEHPDTLTNLLNKVTKELRLNDKVLVQNKESGFYYEHNVLNSMTKNDTILGNNKILLTVENEKTDDKKIVDIKDVFPAPVMLTARSTNDGKPRLHRRDSHVLDEAIEENTSRFSGDGAVLRLISPKTKDPILAQKPDLEDSGFAPGVCVGFKESSGVVGASYRVKFYDETEALLAPTDVLCITAEAYDEIMIRIGENESDDESDSSSTISSASSNSSMTTIGSKWNNISEK